MNTLTRNLLIAALLLAVAGTGYWLGTQHSADAVSSTSERKPLYYRNPMGLPDTSPVPKKDSMGMDYIPVYAEEERSAQSSGMLDIDPAKVQRLGVRSEVAVLRTVQQQLRATGRIEIDEHRLYTIAPKFSGWVERLHVATTGQSVQKGEALFDVYSPELLTAQSELALAQQGANNLPAGDAEAQQSMQRLLQASRTRLANLDMPDSKLNGNRLTYRAPAAGIVLEKNAVEGMRFMAGEMLYRIADLSSLWIIAEINEQDVAHLKVGDHAQVTVDALPGRSFDGKVDFIYPTLVAATRTVQVRIVARNPDGLLKPAMYAQVELLTGGKHKVLAIPTSAVIDSGSSQSVLVRKEQGRFEPRTVQLGLRDGGYVEVRAGVSEGEQVVTRANFLLDSESNLKAALSGMSTPRADKPKSVGHMATGILEEVLDDGNVSITHEPIPALQWPGMTMEFLLANPTLVSGVKPGSTIEFEIVERGEGEWMVTKLKAKEQQNAEHRH